MFLTSSLARQTRLAGRKYLSLCRSTTSYSTQPPQKEEPGDFDKPIVYTQSPANKWKAEYSRQGTSSERLWYEPVVVLTSLTVFMVYFCILREESDIDQEFDTSLYSRIKGLEEQQLLLAIKYRQDQGLDVSLHEKRLEELRKQAQ